MSFSTKEQRLMKEIFVVTETIHQKFPTLYANLSETPLFLSSTNKDVNWLDFEQYLESIKLQLLGFEHSQETHI